MYLYCEKANYNKYSREYELFFDIYGEDHESIEFFRETFTIGTDDDSSIIILKNVRCETHHEFREGYWYNFPQGFFRNFNRTINSYEENSIILIELEYASRDTINSLDFIEKDRNLNYNTVEYQIDSGYLLDERLENLEGNDALRLYVRNVGIGNWNEIRGRNNRCYLVYDFGVDMKYDDDYVETIITNLNYDDDFCGVLSHFDLDHYRGLLSDNFPFNRIISLYIPHNPNHIPNTQKYRRLMNILCRENVRIVGINPITKINNRIRLEEVMQPLPSIRLYRATEAHNKNNSGIVLVVSGRNRDVILTGDHYYRYLLPVVVDINNGNRDIVLVIPHHLGNGGKFRGSDWSNIVNLRHSIASTRPEIYNNLPNMHKHNYFSTHTTFRCTEPSCDNGDIVIDI